MNEEEIKKLDEIEKQMWSSPSVHPRAAVWLISQLRTAIESDDLMS